MPHLPRANDIRTVLNLLYPNPPIPLNHSDNFTFLVAVVLSAQTTDGKVNDVTNILFKHASTPHQLAVMRKEDVQDIIQSVGLAPKKAAYLVGLSQKLVTDFNGLVPSTYAELESLPGVGHKTASVIMSQAFGEPALAVDTHVHRLALRWGLSKEEKDVNKVQRDLCSIFPTESWNDIHLQMIYFGREYCTAQMHTAADCPVCSWVKSTTKNIPSNFEAFVPKKKAKGIVYYHDRLAQVQENPDLTACSPLRLEKTVVRSQTSANIANVAVLNTRRTRCRIESELSSAAEMKEKEYLDTQHEVLATKKRSVTSKRVANDRECSSSIPPKRPRRRGVKKDA